MKKLLKNQHHKNKLATVVEGEPDAPFSMAIMLTCRGGHNSFLRNIISINLQCTLLPNFLA